MQKHNEITKTLVSSDRKKLFPNLQAPCLFSCTKILSTQFPLSQNVNQASPLDDCALSASSSNQIHTCCLDTKDGLSRSSQRTDLLSFRGHLTFRWKTNFENVVHSSGLSFHHDVQGINSCSGNRICTLALLLLP